jgi:hypothetical protein
VINAKVSWDDRGGTILSGDAAAQGRRVMAILQEIDKRSYRWPVGTLGVLNGLKRDIMNLEDKILSRAVNRKPVFGGGFNSRFFVRNFKSQIQEYLEKAAVDGLR